MRTVHRRYCTPSRYSILTGRYAWRSWLKRGVTVGIGRTPRRQQHLRRCCSRLATAPHALEMAYGMEWACKEGHEMPIRDPNAVAGMATLEWIDFDQAIQGNLGLWFR